MAARFFRPCFHTESCPRLDEPPGLEAGSAIRASATGASSGTHIFLHLHRVPATNTDALIAAARNHGVRVYSALPYYQRAPRRAAVVLGYTTVATEAIEEGVRRLAAAIRATIAPP